MTALQERSGVATNVGAFGEETKRKDRYVCKSSEIPDAALLTGGVDKPYVLGLTGALTEKGISLDLIGSNALLCPQLLNNPKVNFLNLRRDRSHDAGFTKKMLRVFAYYAQLTRYAAVAQPKIFHILWNNKFESFDRTLLMLFYRALGKKIVLTAHNVNAAARNGCDSSLNRFTLRIQYALSDHIFVHTKGMKEQLKSDFAVPDRKISVIPFGINNTVPNTGLTAEQAKERFGIKTGERTLLFFGRIVPYKGLEYLIEAFGNLAGRQPDIRLIIAGAANENRTYWERIQQAITRTSAGQRIIQRIQFIPDEETELFFKAADVLVLPYTDIFQSGLPFLAYSFGLPVIATDVGSLKDEINDGATGFVCPPKDPTALASAMETYFSSDLYKNLKDRRHEIREYANERYSWTKVADVTTEFYSKLLETGARRPASGRPQKDANKKVRSRENL